MKIVDELPAEVFISLVIDRNPMRFLPIESEGSESSGEGTNDSIENNPSLGDSRRIEFNNIPGWDSLPYDQRMAFIIYSRHALDSVPLDQLVGQVGGTSQNLINKTTQALVRLGTKIVNDTTTESKITSDNLNAIFQLFVKEKLGSSINRNESTTLADSEMHENLINSHGITLKRVEFVPYDPAKIDEKYLDLLLQTNIDEQRLNKNLLTIYRKASSVMEDQGYNTLFLSLGMLEWYESPDSNVPIQAPILLVPVELKRKSVRDEFNLHPFNEDPILNPALQMKLENEFGIVLEPLPDNFDDFDPQMVFSELASAVTHDARWKVFNDIYLGLFSFMKFVMYKDIEAHIEVFANNPIIRALAGDVEEIQYAGENYEGVHLDAIIDPKTTFNVLETDSSQQEAIIAVNQGCNLILEGPPGTGKSQTIANMIAESLAKGRTVLFVSEKPAALEVVQRRLNSVGIGEFCLELHSHKANKREVIQSLGKTLDLSRGLPSVQKDYYDNLVKTRETLNSYTGELHKPFGTLNMTPFQAIGEVSSLESIGTPSVLSSFTDLDRWTLDDFKTTCDDLSEFSLRYKQVKPIEVNSWYGSDIKEVTYQTKMQVQQLLEGLLVSLGEIDDYSTTIERTIGLRKPNTFEELMRTIDLFELLKTAPRMKRVQLTDVDWIQDGKSIKEMLLTGKEFKHLLEITGARFDASIFEMDVERIRDELEELQSVSYRYLLPRYWRTKGELKGIRRDEYNPTVADLVTALDQVIRTKKLGERIREFEEYGAWAFGDYWQGTASNWDSLESIFRWGIPFREAYVEGFIGDRTIMLIEKGQLNSQELNGMSFQLQQYGDGFHEAWSDLTSILSINWESIYRVPMVSTPLHELHKKYFNMYQSLRSLDEWARYNKIHFKIGESKAREFIEKVIETDIEPDRIVGAFRMQFLKCWMDLLFHERTTLMNLDRKSHDSIMDEFQRLDGLQKEISKIEVRQALINKLPDASWESTQTSELGILRREVRKKRRHLPLRKLFQRIPNVLKVLKPCLLMSPLSVAQYLVPGSFTFDVVIFDEASQIPTEDAVGSMIRGSQVVVVGDTKQLPPTTFFKSEVMMPEDIDEEDEYYLEDLESILDDCAAAFPEQNRKMLRWHYRSRHESLIAFSNHEFYSNGLYTFPSPEYDFSTVGINLIHLPDAIYDRGKSSRNMDEARKVAEEVINHYRTYPGMSLGVGTFSVQQQYAIEDMVDELRRQNPDLEEFFNTSLEEKFFVKNLERIQGDERDVIFISVGYGKDETGRLSMLFGPLNKAGGERRLNVLVTRARHRIKLFTSILGDDIDLSRTKSIGARLLKLYLDYAASGGDTAVLPREGSPLEETESPFEEAVYRALTSKGFDLDKQVGACGYRIDLAVKDPDAPGRYLLGIECDGASYHSSRTARDRDRLRQEVLEGLGWNIYRIWSTDWFRNPEGEIELIQETIDSALAKRNPSSSSLVPKIQETGWVEMDDDSGVTEFLEENETSNNQNNSFDEVITYEKASITIVGLPMSFYEISWHYIADVLEKVVRVEGPIHKHEAAKRVAEHWNITRIGSKIERIVENAGRKHLVPNSIVVKGEFYWPADMEVAPIRSRDTDVAPKDIELIAPEEIEAVIQLVLRKEFSVPRDRLIFKTGRILGYRRTSKNIKSRISSVISDMTRSNTIELHDHGIILVNKG